MNFKQVMISGLVTMFCLTGFAESDSFAGTLFTPPPNPNIATCFSPQGGCDRALIQFLTSARISIDIAIYSITLPGIVDAIVAAKNRGVQVRMVVDRSQSKGASSLTGRLVSAGVPLKIGNVQGIMHDKFSIVDHLAIETGSYNYSDNATLNNAENQLYLRDPGVVQVYSANFETLWQNGLSN